MTEEEGLLQRIEKMRDGGVDGLYDVDEILTELSKTIADLKINLRWVHPDIRKIILKALDSKREAGE